MSNFCNQIPVKFVDCCQVMDCMNIGSADNSVTVVKENCGVDLSVTGNNLDNILSIQNGQCITFVKEFVNGKLQLTPVIDWECAAEIICEICNITPIICDAPEDLIVAIYEGLNPNVAQFDLTWTPVNTSGNATAQRAYYRQRSAGGSFITAGFSPVNDLLLINSTTRTPNLSHNLVYQMKVVNVCSTGALVENDNGVQEQISFVCIDPTLSATNNSATISIPVSGTDITKATITLKRFSDDVVVYGPSVILSDGTNIATTATGLASATNYYWEYSLTALVNGVEVTSSNVAYIGDVCGPFATTTL